MAINKKLIHFKSKQKFEEELAKGSILDTSIVFIQDSKEISTHGTLYKTVNWSVLGPRPITIGDIVYKSNDEFKVVRIEEWNYDLGELYGIILNEPVNNNCTILYLKIDGIPTYKKLTYNSTLPSLTGSGLNNSSKLLEHNDLNVECCYYIPNMDELNLLIQNLDLINNSLNQIAYYSYAFNNCTLQSSTIECYTGHDYFIHCKSIENFQFVKDITEKGSNNSSGKNFRFILIGNVSYT
jgi:hypothetical protein